MKTQHPLLQEISKDNSTLKKQIDDLAKQTNQKLKTHRKVGYIANTPTQFTAKNPKLDTVSTLLNQASATDRFNSKIEKQKVEQAEREVAECTFHPEINHKSKLISQTLPKDRLLISRKVKAASAEIEREPTPDQTQKIHRPFNKDFYNEKMEWKVERENKRLREELMISGVQTIRANAFPRTNKEVNEIVAIKQGDFETRLATKMVQSKIIKEKLEGQIYNHTFRPKLNKYDNIKHAVYEPPRPKLA